MDEDFYPRSPRGERQWRSGSCRSPSHFYPRSPRGERPTWWPCVASRKWISIHAPREGSDKQSCKKRCNTCYFYPRSPRGERRSQRTRRKNWRFISIHAPREGSDACCRRCRQTRAADFYPRSPRGERRAKDVAAALGYKFLSTLPARGATAVTDAGEKALDISIHAPREGSDPTAPGGIRRLDVISIHAPREGSD